MECGRIDTVPVLGLALTGLTSFTLVLLERAHYAAKESSYMERPKKRTWAPQLNVGRDSNHQNVRQKNCPVTIQRMQAIINCCCLKPLKFGMVGYTPGTTLILLYTGHTALSRVPSLSSSIDRNGTGELHGRIPGWEEVE